VNDKFKSKMDVLRAVGEWIVNSPTRTDPTLCALKEKEGVFDMAAEEAEIAGMMQQLHGPMAGAPQQAAPTSIKADKKRKKR
jgi:hypothetical protein